MPLKDEPLQTGEGCNCLSLCKTHRPSPAARAWRAQPHLGSQEPAVSEISEVLIPLQGGINWQSHNGRGL